MMDVTYTLDGGHVVYSDGTRVPAISGGGPSDTKQTTTQTVTRNVAPASLQETRAQDLASAQLDAYNRQLEAYMAGPQYTLSQDLTTRAEQNLLDRYNGTSPLLSAQEQSYLDQAFSAPTQQALDALRQQALADAQRRNMTLTDSPTGNEYLRQVAAIQADAASKRAQAGLNLSQQNTQNYQGAAQFGQNLAQNALQNRLALQNQAAQFANAQAQNRIAAAPVTTTGTVVSSQPWTQSFAQIGQGMNGLFGSRDQSAVGGLLNFGRAAMDPQGFIRSGASSIGNSISNAGNSMLDRLYNTPGSRTVPYYGSVSNVPNYGSNWD